MAWRKLVSSVFDFRLIDPDFDGLAKLEEMYRIQPDTYLFQRSSSQRHLFDIVLEDERGVEKKSVDDKASSS